MNSYGPNVLEEVDTISVAVAGIDTNNVQPMDHRRLVAFINQYLTSTVSFLNHFARSCEDKLSQIHFKIKKCEADLCILESKLASCSTFGDEPPASDSKPDVAAATAS